MNYEKENQQLKSMLDAINQRIYYLENCVDEKSFKYNSNSDAGFYYGDTLVRGVILDKLKKMDDYNDYRDKSDVELQVILLKRQKSEIENRLRLKKWERKTIDGLDFMSSITPQHVSGRIYSVENGDGCAKFCLWFVIIDALIIGIYYLITEVI